MNLVKPQSSSHWYYPDGTACHSVPMASDPKKTRDTNLSDARKLGLFPSVTNVIGMLAKPQLESWKIEQGILAALTLPAIPGETIDERARRVVRDSGQQVDDARKRGHLAHKCVEDYLVNGVFEPHDIVAQIMSPFKAWFDENITEVIFSERTIVGDGYAGRLDLLAWVKGYDRPAVLDFKTRKPSQGKLHCYDEDGIQLSAYRAGINLGDHQADKVMSVLINSETPSVPTLHVWEDDDTARYTEAFFHCFGLWKILKNYAPTLSK